MVITGKKVMTFLFESSRPRELPPQPLTDPDVNLSIHPALIVQPQASGPTANVQTGKETAYEAAASTGLHGVGAHETSDPLRLANDVVRG